MNIGILEDEALTALFLQDTIEELGHNVVGIFSSGNKLLNFLEDSKADLLLIDINIKGEIDGIETALALSNKDIPVVFITSYKDSNTIKRAHEANTIGYLIKPVNQHHIEAILELSKKFIKKSSEKVQLCENLFFSLEDNLLYYKNEPFIIGEKELLCLKALVENRERYISRQELIEYIWYEDLGGDRRSSLRELISRTKRKVPCISMENLRGVGYKLNLEN